MAVASFEDIIAEKPISIDSFGSIIGTDPNVDMATLPQDQMPEDVRSVAAKVKNAYYYSRNLGISPDDAYEYEPQINEQLFGPGTTSEAAWSQMMPKILGARRKSISEAAKHGFHWVDSMAQAIAGLGREYAETKGLEASFIADPVFRWMFDIPKSVNLDKLLIETSNAIDADIKASRAAHPEMGYAIDPDAGFSETLWQMVSRPENVVQGIVEMVPLLMEGTLGTMAAGPAGGITAVAVPMSGSAYQNARSEGTGVIPAFARANIESWINAAIAQWSLNKNIKLAENFTALMENNKMQRLMWEGVKAEFRGSAKMGSMQFNQNFWKWLFTDRSQKWSEGVKQAAAMGGPWEVAMAGGFAGLGKIGKAVTPETAKQRLDILRRSVNESDLPTEQKAEILDAINKAPNIVPEIFMTPEELQASKESPKLEQPPKAEVPPKKTKPVEVKPVIQEPTATEKPAPSPEEPVNPKLYIGNVTARAKKVWANIFSEATGQEVLPEDVKGYIEEGFPTKRTPIQMTRAKAESYLKFLIDDINTALDENSINNDADLARINAEWGDVKALRSVLGIQQTQAPYRVVRSGKQLIVEIPNVRQRIMESIKGLGKSTLAKAAPGQLLTEAEGLAARLRGEKRGAEYGYKAGLEKLKEYKKEIQAGKRNLRELTDEMYNYIKTNVPKNLQHKLLPVLKEVGKARTEKTNQKNLMRAIARTEEVLRNDDKVNAIKDLQTTWSNVKSKYRRGKEELGGLNKIARDRLQSLLDTVDLKSLSTAKKEELTALAKQYQSLARELGDMMNQVDPDTGSMLLDVPRQRIEEMSRLGKTALADMNADDIKILSDTIKYIVHQYETEQQLYGERRSQERSDVLSAVQREIVPRDAAIRRAKASVRELGTQSKRGFFYDLYVNESAHLDTLAELVTSGGKSETRKLLFEDLVDGHRKQLQIEKDAETWLAKQTEQLKFTKDDFKSLNDNTITISMGGKNGIKAKVSPNYLLSIYMTSLDEYGLQSLLRTKGHYFEGEHYPAFENVGEIFDATKQLPDNVKQWAESIWYGVNNKYLVPFVNETSLQLEGTEIATNPTYFPIHRYMPSRASGPTTDVAIESEGRWQPRIGGTSEMVIRPFTTELTDLIDSSATYAGMAIPMKNLRSIVNTREWQQAMEVAGHSDKVQAIITLIRRYQKYRTDRSVLEMAGQKFLNRFSRSTLGLRISTIGAQVGSFPAAWAEIGRKYFVPKMTDAQTESRITKLERLSPVFWRRWRQAKINFEIGTLASQHKLETLLYGTSPFLEKPMQALIWGDKRAISIIHAAAENKVEAEMGMKRGMPEFDEAAIRLTEWATQRTQPMWDMLYRSELSSSPNFLLRSTLLFRSAREMQYNILLRANHRLLQNPSEKAAWANDVGSVVAANTLIAVWKRGLKWAIRAGLLGAVLGIPQVKKKDEESVTKELAVDTTRNVLSLAPFGDLVGILVKELNDPKGSVYKVEPYPNPFALLAEEGVKAAYDYIQGAKHAVTGEKYKSGANKGKEKSVIEFTRAVNQTAQIIATLLGIPYTGPVQEFVYPAKQTKKHTSRKLPRR